MDFIVLKMEPIVNKCKQIPIILGWPFFLKKTAAKILQCEFYWPTLFKDSHVFCKVYKNCQMVWSISKQNTMPLNPILVIEIFNCWRIDFMGHFPSSFGFVYILIVIDYVSKWIEAIPCWYNDHKIVTRFLKEIFWADLEYLEPLAVMEVNIFVINHLNP